MGIRPLLWPGCLYAPETPQGDDTGCGAFGKSLGGESGALTMGLVPAYERTGESFLPLPCEVRKLAPTSRSAGNMIVDFPAFRTVRNECLFFKPPSQW